MGSSKSATLPTGTIKKRNVYSFHKFGLKRHKSMTGEDKISKLPDDVLVSILSLLTITEAGRTSVLSHRWEKLWFSYYGVLDFDVRKKLANADRMLWPDIHSNYLLSINQVLNGLLLSGSSLVSDFTVRFINGYNSPKSTIGKFVEFAMAKRFQRLEFDFNPRGTNITSCRGDYYFPEKFYDWIKQPCGLSSISTLTSLTLSHLNITGEFIEGILSNCPLLERLCVGHSWQLTKLKVSAPAELNLKYLMISGNIECLDVSAPNLRSLCVIGKTMNLLHVDNVPKLVDVSVNYSTYLSSSSLSSYGSQFQTLSLQAQTIEGQCKFTEYVALNQLKHLILKCDLYGGRSIVGWMASLLEAFPFLEKFTFEAYGSPDVRNKQREVCKVSGVQHPHQCLKVVEIVGFSGMVNEVELVVYILENAIRLGQVIINRCSLDRIGTPFEFCEEDTPLELQIKEERAMHLKSFVPPGVDFILI